jgi:hypothetical protein
MIIKIIKENEDGSADVQLDDVSPELMQLIVQTGFVKLLGDALEQAKENDKIPALFKKAE